MISVITPCKNIIRDGREACFRKMMESLRGQSCRDFEHIVIDGASGDGTVELLREYAAAGEIDVLRSEPDKNVHEAMNKGLRLARGEYVYMMNSDNYFTCRDFFEMSLRELEREQADFTHADRLIISRTGAPSMVKRGDERAAFFRMPFRYQTMLIRKAVYDETGPFDESYEIAGDYKFMIKMLLAGKRGCYLPRTVLCSLDGGISSDRGRCVSEVSRVLFETYGADSGLSMEECRQIYLRNISAELYAKIRSRIRDRRIVESLEYCREKDRIGPLPEE